MVKSSFEISENVTCFEVCVTLTQVMDPLNRDVIVNVTVQPNDVTGVGM